MWEKGVPIEDGEYVCFTNYGDVFVLHFVDGEGWEKADRFNEGECVEFWIAQPSEGADK